MKVNKKNTLLILMVAAVLTPLKANALEPCDIIEAAINYRYTTHERGICAEDKYLKETYCLRRKNGRSFLSTERYDLLSSGEDIKAPRLYPTLKLDARVKETIKKDRRDISISRSVLDGRKKTEAANTKDDSIATLVATFANTDVIGHHYETKIKRGSKLKGPTHPDVIELKKKYALHKNAREIAVSKTTEQLRAEVDFVDRSHFDLLSSEYSKHVHVNDKITQVLTDWKNLSWQSALDCTDKIRPKNPMFVKSGEDHIIVQTGKKIPSYLLQHPPTFFLRGLALTADSKHAIIQFYSHGGGSSYSLGRPLPMYLLEDVKGEWQVIAAHYAVPTFY